MWLCLHPECPASLQQHSPGSSPPMKVYANYVGIILVILSRCTILWLYPTGVWDLNQPNWTQAINDTQWLRWWWPWQWFECESSNIIGCFGIGRKSGEPTEIPINKKATKQSAFWSCLCILHILLGYSFVKKSLHYFITLLSLLVKPIIHFFIRSTFSDLVMIFMSCSWNLGLYRSLKKITNELILNLSFLLLFTRWLCQRIKQHLLVFLQVPLKN